MSTRVYRTNRDTVLSTNTTNCYRNIQRLTHKGSQFSGTHTDTDIGIQTEGYGERETYTVDRKR